MLICCFGWLDLAEGLQSFQLVFLALGEHLVVCDGEIAKLKGKN